MSDRLGLAVLGARGSMAVGGPRYARYGGNTTSFHVDLGGGEHLVVDCGTGLRSLGHSLGPGPHRFTVFLTHYHWDHLQGLPLFRAVHDPANSFRFVGASHEGTDVEAALQGVIRPPWFPLALEESPAAIEYLPVPDQMTVGPIVVRSLPLTHPQGSTGYRLDGPEASVVIATDHEAGDSAVDEALAGFAAGADVLIHDGQYTDREYAARTGWGHSTPDGAVDAARAAGVRRLVLTSHDPDHADRDVDDLVTTARIRFPLTAGAHEGMAIEL